MLGVPVHFPGDPSFVREVYLARLQSLQQACAALLSRTRDPQTQVPLLRGCFSACRFTFLSRATCSFFAKDILLQASNVLRETMEAIAGTALSDHQWLQCTLSPAEGGLGVESPHTQAPAASLAGVIGWTSKGQGNRPTGVPPSTLFGTNECVQWMRSMVGEGTQPLKKWAEEGRLSGLIDEHAQQDWWSGMVHKSLKQTLLQECQARDSVRLRCQDSASCSAWSRAPPSSALGTKLSSERFRTIIRWYLGIPVLNPIKAGTGTTKCQLCGDPLDAFGDHAVSCLKNNLWQRHFLVQDYLLRQCRSAGIQCLREQSLLHSERREADLLIPNWSGTQPLAIDLTIRHPRAPGLPFADPDGVLLGAEAEKRRHAQQRARSADCLFEPLVMHTWSGLSGKGSSRTFLHTLLGRIADNRPGMDKPAKLTEMYEALSCIIMAQVAAQIWASIGPWEVPVMPSCEVPLRVDENGNGMPGPSTAPKDTYHEIWRRTRRSRKAEQTNELLPAQPHTTVEISHESSQAFAPPSGLTETLPAEVVTALNAPNSAETEGKFMCRNPPLDHFTNTQQEPVTHASPHTRLISSPICSPHGAHSWTYPLHCTNSRSVPYQRGSLTPTKRWQI